MLDHQVITATYPENYFGGIMICGINYGYSSQDESKEHDTTTSQALSLSFFSNASIDRGRFSPRIQKWLNSWGFGFASKPGEETSFEKSFLQTNWLDTQSRSVTSDGKITVNTLVEESTSFLELLKQRKPSTIVFAGSSLIEAFNDIRIRDQIEDIFGERSGKPDIYVASNSSEYKRQFKVLHQRYGSTHVISLPHPQTRGLSDEYMSNIKLSDQALSIITNRYKHREGFGLEDTLFPEARNKLPHTQEHPISWLQRTYQLGYERALRLYSAVLYSRDNVNLLKN